MARQHPQLRARILEAEPEQALALLKQHDLDLALIYRYPHLGTGLPPGISVNTLFKDPLLLAVPEAIGDIDGVGRLRDHPWISTPTPSGCHDVLLHACQSAGFTPTIEHRYRDLRAGLALVATGRAVTILPAMQCRSIPPGVALITLPGKERTVEAAYRAGTESHPALAAALDLLRATRGSDEAATLNG